MNRSEMVLLSIRLLGDLSAVDYRGNALSIGNRRTQALVVYLAMKIGNTPSIREDVVTGLARKPSGNIAVWLNQNSSSNLGYLVDTPSLYQTSDLGDANVVKLMDVGGTMDVQWRSVDLIPGRESDAATFAKRLDVAPSVSWKLGGGAQLESGMSITDERQRYKLGQLYQHSDNTQLSARLGGWKLTRTGRLGTTLYASRFEHLSRRSTTPLPASHDGERDEQMLVKLDITGSGMIAGMVIDAGLDSRRESSLAERVEGGRRSLHTVEPYAQTTLTRRGVTLVPGARMSWSEQWGTAVTPKAAMMWRPLAPLAVRASVASGYRAPDFKELYLEFVNAPAGYAVRGNPDLRPEHSTNFSGGVDWLSERVNASASVFHSRFRDFIVGNF
jgi:outer membrane receptor for ferrienterochelin and colicins